MSAIPIRKEFEIWLRQSDATGIQENRADCCLVFWSDGECESRPNEFDRATDHFTLWDV